MNCRAGETRAIKEGRDTDEDSDKNPRQYRIGIGETRSQAINRAIQ